MKPQQPLFDPLLYYVLLALTCNEDTHTIILRWDCQAGLKYMARTIARTIARTYSSLGLEKGSKQTNTKQRTYWDGRPSLLNAGWLAACHGRYGI